MARWQAAGAGCVLVGALMVMAFAPAVLAAGAVTSLKAGPALNFMGPELEISPAPRLALVLWAAIAGQEQGARSEMVAGGVRYFFRPHGNRWLLTAYAGGVRSVPEGYPATGWSPLLWAAGGYEWNLHRRWRASAEFGIGVTVLPVLIVAVPVPIPVFGVSLGYRF